MMDVKLSVPIICEHKSIQAGTVIAVSEEVAKRWECRKIASIIRDAPNPPEPEPGGDDLSSLSEKTALPQSKKRTNTSEAK